MMHTRESDEAYIVMQLAQALHALRMHPEGSDPQIDAVSDAINNACGTADWAFYDDDEWYDWTINSKATQHEILIEMLKRCLVKVGEKHDRLDVIATL